MRPLVAFLPGAKPCRVGRLRFVALLLLLAVVRARALHAQDDHAAGLFAAARQLPLVAQSMTVRQTGGGFALPPPRVAASLWLGATAGASMSF